MDLPVPAHFKHAKQGGKLLLCPEGYEFNKVKEDKDRIHFVCRMKKKYGCKVTAAVTVADNMLVRMSGDHNHDTDIAVKKVKEKENNAIKEGARNPTVSPRSVLANLTTELMGSSSTSINHLSKSRTFVKKLQRERNKLVTSAEIPRTWDKMSDIPEELKVTAGGDEFLICNKQPKNDDEKIILGFSSPTALDTLDSSESWYGDGTFSIAKSTLFSQVFIIIAKTLTGITVSCCYFLLPNKETETYKTMFLELKERGVTPPKLFYSDFEAGITKSFSSVFPTSSLYSCDAHFKRAIRTNLQKYGLITIYNSEEKFQDFIRYFLGLSLVRLENVLDMWENFVLPACPDAEEWDGDENDLQDFINYLLKTWIGAIHARSGQRRYPMFRHEQWHKVDAVLNDEDTTTNCSEGLTMPSSFPFLKMPMSPR